MGVKKNFYRTVIIIIFIVCIFSFSYVQASFLKKNKKKHAVVSGQSITGMIAALILAKSGYDVDTYEIRKKYTRNIQWAARQSLIDELASIDVELANSFLEQVAQPIYRGSIHKNPIGIVRVKKHDDLRNSFSNILPRNGEEMISFPSVVVLETKVFEKFLRKYLHSLTNIHCHFGSINLRKNGEFYSIDGKEIPDLIVIAEGANSKTRNFLNINWNLLTTPRLQISGVIGIDSGGVMIKHWREEKGKYLLTGVIGKKNSKKTWIVADVDPARINSQSQINKEFRRLASESLGLPKEKIDTLEIFGLSEDREIRPFVLQQKIAETASIGENVILIGDAVGTGHWSVGGGMQIGAVCHAERLKTLISDLKNQKLSKKTALNQYSKGVLSDTKAWGKVSLKDFYPQENMVMKQSVAFDSH